MANRKLGSVAKFVDYQCVAPVTTMIVSRAIYIVDAPLICVVLIQDANLNILCVILIVRILTTHNIDSCNIGVSIIIEGDVNLCNARCIIGTNSSAITL